MDAEKKLNIAAGLVFVLILLIAVVPYRASLSTRATVVELGRIQNREEKFEQLIDALRDAETGQRGYLITAKDSYLEPYHVALGEIPDARGALLQMVQTQPQELAALEEIFRMVDLKLKDMAHMIEVRRAKGLAMAEPVIAVERGKEYMDALRQLIAVQQAHLASRRGELRQELERKSQDAFAVEVGATVANLLLLALLMVAMTRVLKARQATAALVQETANTLGRSAAEAERRNVQMEVSAEMLQALGSISSAAETSRIIASYCAKLLPGMSGTVYLYRSSRDLLEAQASWGGSSSSVEQLEPKDCWALQRGRAHATRNAGDLCCAHYALQAVFPVGRLCIPLVTQGEVIGLIYFEGLAEDEASLKAQQQMLDRLTEQIALALSNVRLRETLRMQSIIDPLTGLFNRRYMDETLKRELGRTERKGLPLSLIVLDLDHFKRVNDTFGHDAGDLLLKSVANQVRDNIRESDLACRFGGEELVLILPECDLATALERAERIRVAIASIDLLHAGQRLAAPTASFGVSQFPLHGADATALLKAADQALYRAKHSGRNRVVEAEA